MAGTNPAMTPNGDAAMVALKTADIEKFLARPDPARPVVLVYGPDAGLVSERVNALIKASVDDVNDPFSLVRLEAEDLSANPARLVEEAQTIPLFGGRRAVWAKAGSRNIAPAVEAVLALPSSECRLVIEAGDLRRNAPLRVVCERAKNAAALPCYADTERDLARLIDSEMREAELTLKPDARAMLIPLLGGDRAASRNELRKLALYARGRGEVDVDDVTAVVSDASALALDDLIDTAFAGRPAELEAHLAKVRAAGSPVGSIFFAAQRQLAQLHRWRMAIESGAPFSIDSVQPPLHFRRKTLVEAALKQWNAARLLAAMTELADAVLASRKTPALADTIAERALLSLATKARRAAA
jgi:DNA polymerase III subunit delta